MYPLPSSSPRENDLSVLQQKIWELPGGSGLWAGPKECRALGGGRLALQPRSVLRPMNVRAACCHRSTEGNCNKGAQIGFLKIKMRDTKLNCSVNC